MTPFGKEPATPTPAGRPSPAVTVVARETRFVGELSGNRGVRVEGRVKGSVSLKAPLEVVDGAHVEAEVTATSIRIGGTVVGNVTATELVELLAGATVKGDISTPALHVVEGAKLEGRVQMRLDDKAAGQGPPAITATPERKQQAAEKK